MNSLIFKKLILFTSYIILILNPIIFLNINKLILKYQLLFKVLLLNLL